MTTLVPFAPLAERAIGTDDALTRAWLDVQQSPATRAAYQHAIAWWRRELGGELGLTRPHLLRELLDVLARHRGVMAPATLAHRVAALRSLLTLGQQIGYLAVNPGPLLRVPPAPRRTASRILEPDEIHAMLNAATSPRDRAIVRVLYVGALRVAELVALDWDSVHFYDKTASLTIYGKGGVTREVALTPATAAELERFGGDTREGPLFRSRTGRRLGARDVRRLVVRVAHGAQVDRPVSPHWFRHSFATHATSRGAPVAMVAAHLGHANMATTSIYLHVRPRPDLAQWIDL